MSAERAGWVLVTLSVIASAAGWPEVGLFLLAGSIAAFLMDAATQERRERRRRTGGRS